MFPLGCWTVVLDSIWEVLGGERYEGPSGPP
jgi:hypothetical protein